MIMKKLLTITVALICAVLAPAQTMKEIPYPLRFHAMSENGKYLLGVEQGYIGIYDTESGELQQWSDPSIGYDLGMGNMVTNDGYLVGCVNGIPSILDINNKTWTELGLNNGDETLYSCANAITPSRKYIVGYVSTGNKDFGSLAIKPVIWTHGDDGKYGVYDELPYPETDFTGAKPKYILPNCISEDGTVIAAQLVMQENGILPMLYRKTQDGTWTYEVYDKDMCEPETVFPEYPEDCPEGPDFHSYMTAEELASYRQDSIEYEDSCWAWQIGESTEYPSYWPDPKYYMTDEALAQYNSDWSDYEREYAAFSEKLNKYRYFLYDNIKPNFFAQNGVWLTSNGKYYATTKKDWSVAGGSVMFTVGQEEMEKHDYGDNLFGYCATNEGDFFVSDTGTAYVYPAGSTERVTLQDWLRSKGEDEAADWLDNVITGTAICSSDGRVLSGFYGTSGEYRNWIIKLDGTTTGITEVEKAAEGKVKVYDLQGRLVTEGDADTVKNGLQSGIYIINNKKVTVK